MFAFLSKKAFLRRRIDAVGFSINRDRDKFKDWSHWARQANRGASSVALQALIETEADEREVDLQAKVLKLEALIEQYEEL